MEIREPKKVKWQDVKMKIHNKIKMIREVNATVYPNGSIAISVDEYNRILWELYYQDKKKK